MTPQQNSAESGERAAEDEDSDQDESSKDVKPYSTILEYVPENRPSPAAPVLAPLYELHQDSLDTPTSTRASTNFQGLTPSSAEPAPASFDTVMEETVSAGDERSKSQSLKTLGKALMEAKR